jgi:putative endonuclease
MPMYVYVLRSISHPDQRYVGLTSDLKKRLAEHNACKSPHTSKFAPWELVVAIYFKDRLKAEVFERYLKQGSGHAFANRHLW